MLIFEIFKASLQRAHNWFTDSGDREPLVSEDSFPIATGDPLLSSPSVAVSQERGRYGSVGDTGDTGDADDKTHYSAESDELSESNGRSVNGADEQPTPEPSKWCGLPFSLFGRARGRNAGETILLRSDFARNTGNSTGSASASDGNGNSTEDADTRASNANPDFN